MVCWLLLTIAAMPSKPSVDPIAIGFRNVPNEARMRMYWRVFGPAWQPAEINDELDHAKAVGLGGLVAYFMYPVALDDPSRGIKNIRFGSPEFLRTFAYAARQAQIRGLRFGINGGTGWPYGGAHVTIADAARQLKEVIVPTGGAIPVQGTNDRIVAAFVGDRALPLPLSPGTRAQQQLRLYVESPTGQQVKRAAFGAEGLVLDHFNEPALLRWLESTVRPLLSAAQTSPVQALGCDSLEVYGSNWARDLPAEFLRRRGYDFTALLPAIFGDSSDNGNALRFDYWRTLMELTEERFTQPLANWSKAHGVRLEMEAYGTPPNPMTSFRFIDVPTGEHYEWRGFAVEKFVASGAHIAGRNIVGCEAWTWAGLPNRLADTLSDLKVVSDMEFLTGSNDLTAVDYPYSPRSVGQPGWEPYYGPTMNQNNPQWESFPGLVNYVNRCQWMLRQGRPKVSVALYLPVEDCLARGGMEQMQLDFLVRDHFVTGKATSEFGLQNALHHRSALLQGLISNGLDYDGIDLWAMNRMARIRDDQLVAGTSRYHAVILPNLEALDAGSAMKVRRFAEAGGLVVAVRRIPRLRAGMCTGREQTSFRKTMQAIFGAAPMFGEAHVCAKGAGVLIEQDGQVGPFLAAHMKPQIRFEPLPDSVGFVHRALPDRDIYFLANVQTHPVHFEVDFPQRGGSVEAWDAETGDICLLPRDSRGRVNVSLQGRASIFLVRPLASSHAPKQLSIPKSEIGWNPRWHVHFEGPAPPPDHETDELVSWTVWQGARFFSGIGVYEANLDWHMPGRRAVIELPRVFGGAKVIVNGRLAGYALRDETRLEIGRLLRRGVNRIEIRVGNVPANRFIGLPEDDLKPLRARYGNRFPAPEEKQLMKEPAPSGLAGRVRILAD